MNQQNPVKWLYVAAALLIVAGAAVCLLHLSIHDLGMHLVLAGHLFILTAILLQMKQIRDMENRNEWLHTQAKEYKNK
ncbi:hypothetical protein I2I11_01635 [Pontibacter sp. 172403-2]|uniref:hypothetical protein n=1 Tax=Pontibacter rufus TaxID=2791028 RepID=UPI0018AF9568|nr:hypothetical protein [Pontibacter sp. 172403-2]MBF9251985.1 hypothetical protein [Pontibacter sp. 172403-2]